MNKSNCFWCTPQGICGWDISQPNTQVLCFAGGCKDYEPPITAEDYKYLQQ